MKYLSLLISLTIFTSCNVIGIPPERNIIVERCFPLMEVLVKSNEDIVKGVCQCHSYMIGDEVGRVSESVSKPLMYCNKQAAFINYPNTLYLYIKEWSVFLLQQE